jgi:MFS family permease
MEFVAQSWLVFQLTNSPLLLGVTGLTQAVPSILLTFLGGAIADRSDRKRIMLITQGTSGCLFFVMATLVSTGMVRLWHVLVLAFASGCLKAFDRPSRLAILPQTVPRVDMANAVAWGSSIWQLNRMVGPAVAGMSIYLLGVGPTYYACSAASFAAVSLWSFIRIEQIFLETSRKDILQYMLEGLKFIRRNEVFYTFITMTFFNSVFGMSYIILMPVFARDILLVGSQGYGFLQSATGGGALAGTILVAYMARSRRRGGQAVLGGMVFGLLLMGFAFSEWYLLSLAIVFFMGLGSQFYMTTINTILQLKLPEQLRGRVMGIYGLTWDLMPVGGTISGTIAEYAGAPVAVAMGGFLVAGAAFFVALYLPRVRDLE